MVDNFTPPQHKSGRDNWRFGGDRSYMAAAAFKTELSDGLAAYSYRNKGNYFAGRKGAEGYLNNPVYDLQKCYDEGGSDFNCKNSATFIPNMARIYHPGVEVLNSNTETKTLLLKNNWHLPGSHRLGWQYMRTDVHFGEINPFHTTYVMNMEEHNETNRPKELSPQAQSIDSTIRTDTYKLGWPGSRKTAAGSICRPTCGASKPTAPATRVAAWICLPPAPIPSTTFGIGVPNAAGYRPSTSTTTAAATT